MLHTLGKIEKLSQCPHANKISNHAFYTMSCNIWLMHALCHTHIYCFILLTKQTHTHTCAMPESIKIIYHNHTGIVSQFHNFCKYSPHMK